MKIRLSDLVQKKDQIRSDRGRLKCCYSEEKSKGSRLRPDLLEERINYESQSALQQMNSDVCSYLCVFSVSVLSSTQDGGGALLRFLQQR